MAKKPLQNFILIFTTVQDKHHAKILSEKAILEKLAVCVHVEKIKSLYFWEGKLCKEREYRLLFKTVPENTEKLQNWLQENHPYQTPAVVQIVAKTTLQYATWARQLSA